MKKLITLSIITYLLFTINSSAVNENSSENNLENPNVLKIGVLLPLSGKYKTIGESFLKAIQLALYDISNKNIKIYPKDSKGDAINAYKAAREFEEQGIEVFYLGVDRYGRIDINELDSKITESTALISLKHANSETGVLQDIKRVSEIARNKGVLFHTDAVQSVAKIPFDLKKTPVDMLSISGHKFNGPKGVGALYLKKGTAALFSPVCGGGQEKKRRGGTENVPGIIGFGKACDLAVLRMSKKSCIGDLRDYFLNRIYEMIPGAILFGDKINRLPNTLNISFEGLAGDTLLIALDLDGVAVSTGSACSSGTGLSSHVLHAMGIPDGIINSTIRFSLGENTSKLQLDSVVETLVKAVDLNKTVIL